MISLLSTSEAEQALALAMRQHRVALGLTQKALALRSGVNLFTLRKFEQKGLISLEGFLKIAMVLGLLDKLVSAVKPTNTVFSSIDEVIAAQQKPVRKRGRDQ
jgi:DNA-binding XRE family transcriptional regulator